MFVNLSWTIFAYLRLLLLGNACSFTLSCDIFIIHCFNIEYISRYYLNSALDKFFHLESL